MRIPRHPIELECHRYSPDCGGHAQGQICRSCTIEFHACPHHLWCPKCLTPVAIFAFGSNEPKPPREEKRKRPADDYESIECIQDWMQECDGEVAERHCDSCGISFNACDGHAVCPGCNRSLNQYKRRRESPVDDETDAWAFLDQSDDGVPFVVDDDQHGVTVETRDNRRHGVNTFAPSPVRIGVATWNVNHYRDQEIDDLKLRAHYADLVARRENLVQRNPRLFLQARLQSGAEQGDEIEGLLAALWRHGRADIVKSFQEAISKEKTPAHQQTLKSILTKFKSSNKRKNLEQVHTLLVAHCTSAKRKYLQGVRTRLSNMLKDNFVDEYLRYVSRRLERVDLWNQQVKRLAKFCGVELDVKDQPKAAAPVQPNGYTSSISEFNSDFDVARKSHASINGELKRRSVVIAIALMFKQNPWLDALLLQEVNSGLEKRLTDEKTVKRYPVLGQLGFACGPKLEGGKGATTGEGGGRQYEIYPLVYRKSRLKVIKWLVLDYDGKERHDDPFPWDKRAEKRSFRPIVVHVVERCGQPHQEKESESRAKIHLGIVHTTPGSLEGQSIDREFSRQNEYAQLAKAFETIAGRAAKGEWWIVGGDYYVSPDSIAIDPSTLEYDDVVALLERKKHPALDEPEHPKKKTVSKAKNPRAPKSEVKKLIDRVQAYEKKDLGIVLKNQLLKPTQKEIVRNLLEVTLKHVLPADLAIACAVSGTNWHDTKLLWRGLKAGDDRSEFFPVARVADLFIYTKTGGGEPRWQDHEVGFVHPEGGILGVDREDELTTSTFWSLMSDHFPVGAFFSSQCADDQLQEVLRYDRAAAGRAAAWLDRYRLAFKLRSLMDMVIAIFAYHDIILRSGALPPEDIEPIPDLWAHLFSSDQAPGAFVWWVEQLAGLVEIDQVTKGTGLLVDKKLWSYRQERLADPERKGVRVWDDPRWYGRECFEMGDSHAFWDPLAARLHALEEEYFDPQDRSDLPFLAPHAYGEEGAPLDTVLGNLVGILAPTPQDKGEAKSADVMLLEPGSKP